MQLALYSNYSGVPNEKNDYFSKQLTDTENLHFVKIPSQEVNKIKEDFHASPYYALLDINDASKKDEYELIRRSALGDDEYDRLYGSLSHQFYEKEWFERIAINLDLKCEVRDQDIVGYKNSKLRYNVFLKK
mgnify:CR=1 FL=1